jgi:hypothetical protein
MTPIDEHGWPGAKDRLFPKKKQRTRSAHASDELFAALVRPELGHFYPEGYFEAAKRLSDQALSASGRMPFIRASSSQSSTATDTTLSFRLRRLSK